MIEETQKINLLNLLRQHMIEQGSYSSETNFDALARLLIKMADISRSLTKEDGYEPSDYLS